MLTPVPDASAAQHVADPAAVLPMGLESPAAPATQAGTLRRLIRGLLSNPTSIFGAALLLGFAVVALFVSTFVIANTFRIIIGQRIRGGSLPPVDSSAFASK